MGELFKIIDMRSVFLGRFDGQLLVLFPHEGQFQVLQVLFDRNGDLISPKRGGDFLNKEKNNSSSSFPSVVIGNPAIFLHGFRLNTCRNDVLNPKTAPKKYAE